MELVVDLMIWLQAQEMVFTGRDIFLGLVVWAVVSWLWWPGVWPVPPGRERAEYMIAIMFYGPAFGVVVVILSKCLPLWLGQAFIAWLGGVLTIFVVHWATSILIEVWGDRPGITRR